MLETQAWSLGREDPLEEEMPIHASIHAWKIPWTEEPGGYRPWGWQLSNKNNNKYSIVYVYHIFFTHSTADGRLGSAMFWLL